MKYTKAEVDKQFIDFHKEVYSKNTKKLNVDSNLPLTKSYRSYIDDNYKTWLNILHEHGDITDNQLKSFKTPLCAYNLNYLH